MPELGISKLGLCPVFVAVLRPAWHRVSLSRAPSLHWALVFSQKVREFFLASLKATLILRVNI